MGQQAVREAIRRWQKAVTSVLIEERPRPRAEALGRFAADNGIEVRFVPRGELDRMAGGSMHQGAAALAPQLPLIPASELLLNPKLLGLALDGVVDPQNFGAVIRSAVGLADAPVFWSESSSAPLTPATFRASAGAIEHATLCRVQSLHGTLSEAASMGVEVIGLEPQAEVSLHEVDFSRPTILVIGSEEKGMARAVRKSCTQLVRLTAGTTVQSLNASVAAGIALHTALVSRLRNAAP